MNRSKTEIQIETYINSASRKLTEKLNMFQKRGRSDIDIQIGRETQLDLLIE